VPQKLCAPDRYANADAKGNTGKSELAQQLAHKLGFPVLSVDPIEAAIARVGVA
jgi:hypothetical protein